MPFTLGYVESSSAMVQGDSVSILVRLPWMRSVPWECVRAPRVVVAGRSAPPSTVTIDPDPRAPHHSSDAWRVGDFAQIRVVDCETASAAADAGSLQVAVSLVLPYVDGGEVPVEVTNLTTIALTRVDEKTH
jgi:hypothetical protein